MFATLRVFLSTQTSKEYGYLIFHEPGSLCGIGVRPEQARRIVLWQPCAIFLLIIRIWTTPMWAAQSYGSTRSSQGEQWEFSGVAPPNLHPGFTAIASSMWLPIPGQHERERTRP